MIFQHPFTCLISGPTGCGKTSLVKSMIDNRLFFPKPAKILWFFAEDQPLYSSVKAHVQFIKGLPDDFDSFLTGSGPGLVVFDDLMTRAHSDQRMTKLFSVGSHHRNLSVIFIVHNLFHQGKEMRNLSLNSHYIILFKNPRDKLQISTLARQMYPGNVKFITEAYSDATKQAYGYLLFDLKPETEERLRIRTGILPKDTPFVYIPHDI